ncbi:putative ribonuclease H-like domain-containing protein, partial [Tanacetum coccineum]
MFATMVGFTILVVEIDPYHDDALLDYVPMAWVSFVGDDPFAAFHGTMFAAMLCLMQLCSFQQPHNFAAVNVNKNASFCLKYVFSSSLYERLCVHMIRNKKDERGIVVKNKARLVAQGHTQEEDIDYDEVFVPVKQKSDGIFISQDKYMAEILKKFDFSSIKTASTIMETNKALVKDEEAEDVDIHLYRSMIGSLMYLIAFRPYIMFAICACARFQVTPKTSHFNAVKRIFRYLKGQPKFGLWYLRDSPFDLEAFFDSDYARASLDRKSTTGGCQFLGKRLISWQCKKQTIVANSTTEAEYVPAANCYGQVLWIQNQMIDYGFNFMNTKIYINNESTICIMKNPVSHSKTKHIEIRHHFIRDSYEKKLIQVIKIHTDQNIADLLTKAFDAARVKTAKDNHIEVSGKSKEVKTQRYLSLVVPLKKVGDEVVHKELGDRMERAATTASSLEAEQDSGSSPRCQDTILGDVDAQTRFEITSKQFNDPPLLKVNTFRSGEDSMQLMELMAHYIKLCEFVRKKNRKKCTTEDGVHAITATIDGRDNIITEASIRRHLKLQDSEGLSSLPNAEIFKQLTRMG